MAKNANSKNNAADKTSNCRDEYSSRSQNKNDSRNSTNCRDKEENASKNSETAVKY